MAITAEQFEAATGHPPVDDDLERSNCTKAGELGHFCCGWNHQANLPVFMAGPETVEKPFGLQRCDCEQPWHGLTRAEILADVPVCDL